MLRQGDGGLLAEAERPGTMGTATPVGVLLREKTVGKQWHTKSTEEQLQPEIPPEQTQQDVREDQRGTPASPMSWGPWASFPEAGKEKGDTYKGTPTLVGGVNLNWLNLNSDLTSEWVYLKW